MGNWRIGELGNYIRKPECDGNKRKNKVRLCEHKWGILSTAKNLLNTYGRIDIMSVAKEHKEKKY
ncbi:MAG: hypothetical protein GC181_16080 [Bacteroidetes bacterium]|nr:hypothetical protein [Bacteroidota bacterium]